MDENIIFLFNLRDLISSTTFNLSSEYAKKSREENAY